MAAAQSAGVPLARAVAALARFEGVKRRMQRTATAGDIAIYDDFAHHPTAIRRSLAGLRQRFPASRIVVALEPRSNTMKMGVHNGTLAASLADADLVFVYRPPEMDSAFEAALAPLGERGHLCSDYDELVSAMAGRLQTGDQLVFMSNGGFGGARQKLTATLKKPAARDS